MELVDRDLESTRHLSIEGIDGKSKTTFELVSGENIIPLRGMIRLVRSARYNDGISRSNGPYDTELFHRARAQGTDHGGEPGYADSFSPVGRFRGFRFLNVSRKLTLAFLPGTVGSNSRERYYDLF